MWEDASEPDPMWQEQASGSTPFDPAIFDAEIFDVGPPAWVDDGGSGDGWV